MGRRDGASADREVELSSPRTRHWDLASPEKVWFSCKILSCRPGKIYQTTTLREALGLYTHRTLGELTGQLKGLRNQVDETYNELEHHPHLGEALTRFPQASTYQSRPQGMSVTPQPCCRVSSKPF